MSIKAGLFHPREARRLVLSTIHEAVKNMRRVRTRREHRIRFATSLKFPGNVSACPLGRKVIARYIAGTEKMGLLGRFTILLGTEETRDENRIE